MKATHRGVIVQILLSLLIRVMENKNLKKAQQQVAYQRGNWEVVLINIYIYMYILFQEKYILT